MVVTTQKIQNAVCRLCLVGVGRMGEDGTILLALPLLEPVKLSVSLFKQNKPPPKHLAPKTLCKQLINFQSTLFENLILKNVCKIKQKATEIQDLALSPEPKYFPASVVMPILPCCI